LHGAKAFAARGAVTERAPKVALITETTSEIVVLAFGVARAWAINVPTI
jgi:hypothetical protein